MKVIISIISLVVCSSFNVFANDGGIAAIKVDQIKMRETAIKDGHAVTVRKISNPSFTITIDGGEAKKLQQILPSTVSVITAINPQIADEYNESFKSLGIYNNASKGVTSKALQISCSDAVLSDSGDKIVKTGKSVCTITIQGFGQEGAVEDIFGDLQDFEPKSCK